jgi:hypothetical protein
MEYHDSDQIDPMAVSDSSRRELLDRTHVDLTAGYEPPAKGTWDDHLPDTVWLKRLNGEREIAIVSYTRKPTRTIHLFTQRRHTRYTEGEFYREVLPHLSMAHLDSTYVRDALAGDYDAYAQAIGEHAPFPPLSVAAALYNDAALVEIAQTARGEA